MLNVALDNLGLERIVDTGTGEATAAVVLERDLVTASSDGSVQVWRRSDGALVGRTEAPSPLVALADSGSEMPLLAAVDRAGRLELLDLTDPARPRIRPLDAALSPGEPLRALAFSGHGVNVFNQGADVLAIGARGEVLRADIATGAVVSRGSIRGFRGSLPWRPDGRGLWLTAARFLPEASEDREGVLVATRDGAVAELDLSRHQGKTRVEPGLAPGRILALDRVPYDEPELALGTSGGLVSSDYLYEEKFAAQHGLAVTGVAVGYEEGLRFAGGEGVSLSEEAGIAYDRASAFGPPVRALDIGFTGIAALHPHGLVSVLGPATTGLAPVELEESPVSSFAPDGSLLVAHGYDANHVEEIVAVDPRPLGEEEYEEDREKRTYRPNPSWWPEAEDPEALYVNSVAADESYVVAGGQDPLQTAVVLVWDAKTGKPLHRLALGTGGVDLAEPSIVAKVLLLPKRHEIAAYSAAQELLAVWSTDTWQLQASIPVGPIGDMALSPDESTLVAANLGEDEELEVEPGEETKLLFVDLASDRVEKQVSTTAATAIAFSADGSTLASADKAGTIRFRSANGQGEVRPPIHLGEVAEEMAWSPDGSTLAVDGSEGGIVLVDPESGAISNPLPVFDLSGASPEWSPDGRLLAVPEAEADEDGEGLEPGPIVVWNLGAQNLERRMCQLAGGPATPDDWRGLFAVSSSRPLCRSPQHREPVTPEVDDAGGLEEPEALFESDGSLVAADREGHQARIGRLEQFTTPMPAYDWSPRGLAWSSPGQLNVLTKGATRARSWPCACGGVAWDGNDLVSVEVGGRSLIRLDERNGNVRATPLRSAVRFYSPTLLGMLGDRAIFAASRSEPGRGVPSSLFAVAPGGLVTKLPQQVPGTIYRVYPSASEDTLAFVAASSGVGCYLTTTVGIISEVHGQIDVHFPPSPFGKKLTWVRSVQVAPDGSVAAAIAPGDCGAEAQGGLQPLASRYLLRGGRWRSTGERGWDVQAAADGSAFVLGQPRENEVAATLTLRAGGSSQVLSDRSEGLVVRP
jgi:WD40 repeat protein